MSDLTFAAPPFTVPGDETKFSAGALDAYQTRKIQEANGTRH